MSWLPGLQGDECLDKTFRGMKVKWRWVPGGQDGCPYWKCSLLLRTQHWRWPSVLNLDLDFGLQNCEENTHLLSRSPSLWHFITATWARRVRKQQKRKKKGVTHLKHFFPLPQSFFDFGKLELQDAVGMLLPLELLWMRNTGLKLQFGGVSVTGLKFSRATFPSGQTTLYYIIAVFKAHNNTSSFLCCP